jgi:hypothetical protein
MSLIKRAGDLIYTFRFLSLLVTKFEDTEAFKAGIIDNLGARRKDYDVTVFGNKDALNNYYTPFHRLAFNIKKLLATAPGGSTSIASYAAALYLIKEQYGITESHIERGIKELGVDPTDFLIESNQWFITAQGQLSPGTYKLREAAMVVGSFEELARPKDLVRASQNCFPIGSLFGIDVYECVHIKTNQRIRVTVENLLI